MPTIRKITEQQAHELLPPDSTAIYMDALRDAQVGDWLEITLNGADEKPKSISGSINGAARRLGLRLERHQTQQPTIVLYRVKKREEKPPA